MFNPVKIASEQDFDPVSGKHALEIFITFENFNIYRPQIHENNGAKRADNFKQVVSSMYL